jgi:hypothetical protein
MFPRNNRTTIEERRLAVYGMKISHTIACDRVYFWLWSTVEDDFDSDNPTDNKIMSMIGGRVSNSSRMKVIHTDELEREYLEETGTVNTGAMRKYTEWLDRGANGRCYENHIYLITPGKTDELLKGRNVIRMPVDEFGRMVRQESDMKLKPWVCKMWTQNDDLHDLLAYMEEWNGMHVSEYITSQQTDFIWESKLYATSTHDGNYMIEKIPPRYERNEVEDGMQVVEKSYTKWVKAYTPRLSATISKSDLMQVLRTFHVAPVQRWNNCNVIYDLLDVVEEVREITEDVDHVTDILNLTPFIWFLE